VNVWEDRIFRVWEYSVSHDRLLIRSPKGAGHSRNVDLRFFGVTYMALGTLFRGLRVEVQTPEASRALLDSKAWEENSHVVILHSGQDRSIVVAASFAVEENERDIFDSGM
jgi:uncharacterized membrane-anchored protein